MNGMEPELPSSDEQPAPSPPAGVAPPTGHEFLYPAFFAAICSGVLSGVPVLDLGCLLWMTGGGALAVYFYSEKHGRPLVRPSDGARLGMITGFFGFFFGFFVKIFSQLLIFRGLSHVVDAYKDQIEHYEMPPGPEAAQLKSWAMTSEGMAFFFVLGAIFYFIIFVLLSTVGGAVGVKALKKE